VIYNIAQKVVAVEVKSAATISQDFFKGLNAFESILPEIIQAKAIIYGGDRAEMRRGVHISDVFGIKKFLDSVS
jgi:hypothetical protein